MKSFPLFLACTCYVLLLVAAAFDVRDVARPTHATIAGHDYKFTYKAMAQYDGMTDCLAHIIFIDPSVPPDRPRFRRVLMHEFSHAATDCRREYTADEIEKILLGDEEGGQIHAAIYDIGENLGDLLIDNPQLVPLFTTK